MKRPWEIGKAFDASAPCGPLQPAARIGHPSKGRIALKVNGKVRQDGDLAQMIWNVPEVIVKLSQMVELAGGDIIMTGTPSGVAAIVAGDKLECEIAGVGKLTVTISRPTEHDRAPSETEETLRRAPRASFSFVQLLLAASDTAAVSSAVSRVPAAFLI